LDLTPVVKPPRLPWWWSMRLPVQHTRAAVSAQFGLVSRIAQDRVHIEPSPALPAPPGWAQMAWARGVPSGTGHGPRGSVAGRSPVTGRRAGVHLLLQHEQLEQTCRARPG